MSSNGFMGGTFMKVSLACCLFLSLIGFLRADEAPAAPADEKRLKLAHAFSEQGDHRNAITIFFSILRHTENNDLRGNAREALEKLGFSSQEIFQLEPEKLKGEDMEKILARTAASVYQREKQETDLEYAKHLLK